MTKMPHVTVVVPCFNRELTIEAAISSVLTQDYPDFDVVVVDDASSDGTVVRLSAIIDERLKVISNSGVKGVSDARNTGVSRAKGEWIAFQDSDDIWLPGKLSRQMNALGDEDVAVYCAMNVIEFDKQQKQIVGRVPEKSSRNYSGDILPGLLWTSLVSTQTLIVRREIFEKVGGFDVNLSALVDWELMLRVAQEGTVKFLDEVLVEQRISPNSITKSSIKRLRAQEYIFEKHEALFQRDPKAFARRAFRISGANRHFGEVEESLRYLRKAISIQPWNLRYRFVFFVLVAGKQIFRLSGRTAKKNS